MLKKYILVLGILLFASQAMANISVFPTSIYFEKDQKKKSQTVLVINQTDEPQSYEVSVKNYTPNENGEMKEVETTENSAKDYIIFSPRKFTLPPNKSQNVRVAVRKIAEAKDGEYVSYLHIAETGNKSGKKEKEENVSKKEGMSISINLYMAAAIPVTVEKGNLVAKTEVVGYKKNNNKIDIEFQRKGTKTSRFNVVLLDSKGNEVGRADKIVIRQPNGKRTVSVEIKKTEENAKPAELKLENEATKEEILRQKISL